MFMDVEGQVKCRVVCSAKRNILEHEGKADGPNTPFRYRKVFSDETAKTLKRSGLIAYSVDVIILNLGTAQKS